MKKIFLTIFSIVLVFSLAACSQKSSTKEEKVLKALQNNPQILERFKKFFPFVQI